MVRNQNGCHSRGNYAPEDGFAGAAPECMLIIVKVKQAKKYLREFYLFPPEADLYQEDDIMMGMDFAVQTANERKMPLFYMSWNGKQPGSPYWKKSSK